ncbi:hypothetical protein [Adhaeribacter aquaticus]|uniref:hypothetical protein n=1 Tax=Adhaeribacter aquaticus TaxID=299567 RepID=UPI000415A6EF|nr:hypothetical protein [Adhaeribacter aquaticus]
MKKFLIFIGLVILVGSGLTSCTGAYVGYSSYPAYPVVPAPYYRTYPRPYFRPYMVYPQPYRYYPPPGHGRGGYYGRGGGRHQGRYYRGY